MGYFPGRQVDESVVHAQSGQGGHQVFHGRYPDAAVFQRGTERCLGDIQRVRGNRHRFVQVDAAKRDARVDRRRPQVHVDLAAAVQSDTRGPYGRFESALLQARLPDPWRPEKRELDTSTGFAAAPTGPGALSN